MRSGGGGSVAGGRRLALRRLRGLVGDELATVVAHRQAQVGRGESPPGRSTSARKGRSGARSTVRSSMARLRPRRGAHDRARRSARDRHADRAAPAV